MSNYKINYLSLPSNDTTVCSRKMDSDMGTKEAFWDNNLSLNICAAMIMGKPIEETVSRNVHRLLYGKYLGGFLFEGFELLPPLCILNVISEDIPHNAVYHNRAVFDPKLGIYSIDKYKEKNLQVKSYIQIFIEEAYKGADWRPNVPLEIQVELNKDKELRNFWDNLSSMQQSKILSYIYPFSKESSLKECRNISQRLNSKQVECIINHIKTMYRPQSENRKNVWEELCYFETNEAVGTLKKCGLSEGMIVLDMGCGHAHYTIPAAIAVGENGKIIAVDCKKNILKVAQNRISEKNLTNVVFLNTNENGLSEYKNNFDFIILYDVLHGVEWKDNRDKKVEILHSLLKDDGILSLALYNEIERKVPTDAKPTPKGYYKAVTISHEEAIKPYVALIESCRFKLQSVVKDGGVHFDNFHSPHYWRKYGEVRLSSLERRNIYNFVKVK